MYKIGFDNNKYLKLQSEKIKERIAKFGGKLYLEFGGKLFDDFHASRVLPGFEPDSKIRMLSELKDQAEIIIAVNSADIERLDFALENGEFIITIKVIENPKIIAPENLYNRNLVCKTMTLFKGFSEHFGYKPRLFLESEELDLDKFNRDAMIDR